MEKIAAFIWRVERKTRTILTGSRRPSSLPFISGDGFRQHADHIYEPATAASFDPGRVLSGEIVFVESGILDAFLRDIHPCVSVPHVLVTHNGDTNIDDSYRNVLDNTNVLHWFAQNVDIDHARITPLPIGLENARLANAGLPRLYSSRFADTLRRNEGAPRLEKILYGFNVATNPLVRSKALAILQTTPTAEPLGTWLSQPRYVQRLASALFVASPEGNGIDCIRTWEAMYVGTIPIVMDSVGTRYFRSLGLPLLIVRDWNELPCFTSHSLVECATAIHSESSLDALTMEYWLNKIKKAAVI